MQIANTRCECHFEGNTALVQVGPSAWSIDQRCPHLLIQCQERSQFIPLPIWYCFWGTQQHRLDYERPVSLPILSIRSLVRGERCRCQILVMKVQQAFSKRLIPFRHQDGRVAGRVKTMSPTRRLVDGKRTLVIASMNMTIRP